MHPFICIIRHCCPSAPAPSFPTERLFRHWLVSVYPTSSTRWKIECRTSSFFVIEQMYLIDVNLLMRLRRPPPFPFSVSGLWAGHFNWELITDGGGDATGITLKQHRRPPLPVLSFSSLEGSLNTWRHRSIMADGWLVLAKACLFHIWGLDVFSDIPAQASSSAALLGSVRNAWEKSLAPLE